MQDNFLAPRFIGDSLVTEDVFAEKLLELEQFYDKRLTDFARLAYKTKIGECRDIDNVAFIKAVLFCIGKHSAGGKFFPSADKIIEYAVGTPEERVARQNQKALPPASSGEDVERMNQFFIQLRQMLTKAEAERDPAPVNEKAIEERAKINQQVLETWKKEGEI